MTVLKTKSEIFIKFFFSALFYTFVFVCVCARAFQYLCQDVQIEGRGRFVGFCSLPLPGGHENGNEAVRFGFKKPNN